MYYGANLLYMLTQSSNHVREKLEDKAVESNFHSNRLRLAHTAGN